MTRPRWVWAGAFLLVGCQASTRRPTFAPLPEASSVEVRLEVPQATRLFAEGLRGDSFPVRKVEERDGYLETEWFAFPGWQPVKGRLLGPPWDKVRAWIDPGRPQHSVITVEVAYRLFADPSRDPRELERHVGETHTVRGRAIAVMQRLVERYGGDTASAASPAKPPAPVKPDTTRRDTTGAGG